jgi:hypothetical protein
MCNLAYGRKRLSLGAATQKKLQDYAQWNSFRHMLKSSGAKKIMDAQMPA